MWHEIVNVTNLTYIVNGNISNPEKKPRPTHTWIYEINTTPSSTIH